MSIVQEKYPLKLYVIWLCIGIGLLVFLTWSSLTPLATKGITIKHSDLALHLLAYGSITFWFAQIFRDQKTLIRIAIFMIGYGLLMEAAQGLLTLNRDANLLDAIANTCGAYIGTLLSKAFRPAGLLYRIESLIFRAPT